MARTQKKLEIKYAFIRNPKGSDAIKKFIQTAEQQILNEKTLREDLETKMHFDIFLTNILLMRKIKWMLLPEIFILNCLLEKKLN